MTPNKESQQIAQKLLSESIRDCDDRSYSRALTKLMLADESSRQNQVNEKLRVAIGAEFERHLRYENAWTAMSQKTSNLNIDIPDWDGSSLKGKRLLVVKRMRDIGADLRMARLAELAGRYASECCVIVDQRLIPIFRRSFPSCVFHSSIEMIDNSRYDILASYEILGRYLCENASSIRNTFIPLIPSHQRVRQLRDLYEKNCAKDTLIGLSWHSGNDRKDLPSLGEWGQLLLAKNHCFVSVNYGDRTEDLSSLSAFSSRAIIPDQIDQMKSLDDLAAQIGSLDRLVTISNTAAHMAGAMGISTDLVLTEFRGMTWPYQGSRTPWYPNLRIHRKEDMTWSELFRRIGIQSDK